MIIFWIYSYRPVSYIKGKRSGTVVPIIIDHNPGFVLENLPLMDGSALSADQFSVNVTSTYSIRKTSFFKIQRCQQRASY
jgi:hypothetical protein